VDENGDPAFALPPSLCELRRTSRGYGGQAESGSRVKSGPSSTILIAVLVDRSHGAPSVSTGSFGVRRRVGDEAVRRSVADEVWAS